MELAELAGRLTAFLAPLLPRLEQDTEATSPAQAEVWTRARSLWGALKPRVAAKEAAREAIDDLVAEPADPRAVGAFELQLEKLLRAEEGLAAEVARLLPATEPRLSATLEGHGAIAQGRGNVAAGRGGVAAKRIKKVVQNFGEAGRERGPGAKELRSAYLNRLIAEAGFLALEGVDPAVTDKESSRLRLEGVYTALGTLTAENEVERERGPEIGGTRRLLSALEQLDRHSHLVLLGDPGSGKSTFVNFVALCLAGEALGRSDANLKLLTAPPPSDDTRKAEKPQPWRHGALLPVRVVLRDFAARGLRQGHERSSAKTLWDFLAQELDAAGHRELFPLLQKELLAGRGLVLLDGLDEVPEAERCRAQICRAVEDFSRAVPSRMLVTSRTYAYQKQAWKLAGFEETVLAPFSRGQILRFVDLWYGQMVAVGRLRKEDAAGRATLLGRAILGSDRLLGLAERPLLLTLMASLHAWRGGSLPERREELYADAVELLLNTWERHRMSLDERGGPRLVEPSLAEWLRVDRLEVRQVLEEMAFEAHGQQPDLTGAADLQAGELVQRLLQLNRNPEAANPVHLLDYLRDRSGLLVERGHGVYSFPHRTFQEYLAACHLTGGSFPDEVARLGREAPERWREVVLLAGAKAGRGAVGSVWSLADALCYGEPGGAGRGPADEWGALLAGQAVVESADLSRVGKANEEKLERLRRWHVHLIRSESFPVVERALAGKALAALGDPRFEAGFYGLPREPDLGFVEVPEGPFLIGSTEADEDAYEDERPAREVTLPAYWLGRYPVTVGQFRAYVESTGVEPKHRGSLEGPSNLPVAYVTWSEALSYCEWLGERLRDLALQAGDGEGGSERLWSRLRSRNLRASLPSEAEWEKAARGADGRIYPWGWGADANRANVDGTGLNERSAVGCFLGGGGPYGHEELSGNVWEWTRSLWGVDSRTPGYRYPYVRSDGREALEAGEEGLRVLRGGAFNVHPWVARCACRLRGVPDDWVVDFGFRVVLSPFPL